MTILENHLNETAMKNIIIKVWGGEAFEDQQEYNINLRLKSVENTDISKGLRHQEDKNSFPHIFNFSVKKLNFRS